MKLESDGGEQQFVWLHPSPHPKWQLQVVHLSRFQSCPVILSLSVVDDMLGSLLGGHWGMLGLLALPGSLAVLLQQKPGQGRGQQILISEGNFLIQTNIMN
jgi:hypothetical protein